MAGITPLFFFLGIWTQESPGVGGVKRILMGTVIGVLSQPLCRRLVLRILLDPDVYSLRVVASSLQGDLF